MQSTRAELGLSPSHPALVIFDVFNGQITDKVFNVLEENSIFMYHQIALIGFSHFLNKTAKEFFRSHFRNGMPARPIVQESLNLMISD